MAALSDKRITSRFGVATLLVFALVIISWAAAPAWADRDDFNIEVEQVEDPWAVDPDKEAATEEVAPLRPRPPARPKEGQEDPMADERTDFLQTVLTLEDNALQATDDGGKQRLLAIAGLLMAVVAFICISFAIWYLHRRRQRQADAHAKRYAKKLRKALRRSIRDEHPEQGLSISETISGSPMVDRRQRQTAARQSPVDSQA